MRFPTLSIFALALVACASKPAPKEDAPDSGDAAAAVAGFVADVNEDSGMTIIRTQGVFEPGTVLRVESGENATGSIRVGSSDGGMLAGIVESGRILGGPCILTPMRESPPN